MKAIRDHFTGEGNTTRRMAEVERMMESLHYKNERALTFENFLTNCQKMFNVYEVHGEAMTEEAKIRFLFKKINHEGLRLTLDAMTTKFATEVAGAVTHTTVAKLARELER
jgi:hypothetical protein